MFQFLWTLTKWTLFAAVILIASHTIEWRGKTLSDQVKTTFAQAQGNPWVNSATQWSKRFVAGEAPSVKKREAPLSTVFQDEKKRLKEILKVD